MDVKGKVKKWDQNVSRAVFPLRFDVSACAQKINCFGMLNNVKVKMNQHVPNKSADLLKKIG